VPKLPDSGIADELAVFSDSRRTAFELLVSKTNPYAASTAGDGILDGWAFLWGLNLTQDATAQTGLRANYTYDLAGRLTQVSGARSGTLTPDNEGNLSPVSQ
jgi:hypothetical protein